MRRLVWIERTAVVLACVGLVFPHRCLQAAGPSGTAARNPTQQSLTVADVELQAGGLLHGRVVEGRGKPIQVLRDGHPVARPVTDREGRFTVTLDRGGIYQLVTDAGTAVFRAWSPGTAPPNASKSLIVVSDQSRTGVSDEGVLRLQSHPIGALLSHPIVLVSLVALAVAIPVIIHNTREDRPSGS